MSQRAAIETADEPISDIEESEQRECLMCGHCCGPYFSLYVDECDERRWEAEGRTDLLDFLERERNLVQWRGEEAFNSETGEKMERCVFIILGPDDTVLCGIHDTKPKICRDYPPGSSSLCAQYKLKHRD